MPSTATIHSSLENQVAIVTGATQGVGEAVADLFAARGIAGLVVTGRDAGRGAVLQQKLEQKEVKTVFVQADLSKVEEARRIVAAADSVFGRVDILVNAAGNTDRGTIWDTSPERFDEMFAVNVKAPFFLMQMR